MTTKFWHMEQAWSQTRQKEWNLQTKYPSKAPNSTSKSVGSCKIPLQSTEVHTSLGQSGLLRDTFQSFPFWPQPIRPNYFKYHLMWNSNCYGPWLSFLSVLLSWPLLFVFWWKRDGVVGMSLYSATTVSSSNSGLTSHSSWYPWCSVLLLNHTRDLADVFWTTWMLFWETDCIA